MSEQAVRITREKERTMKKQKQNDRRDAAISYVQRRHWTVFPVPPGLKCGYSKDRHLTDGPWGCTSDADIVRRYWNDSPRANVGLVMGAVSGVWDLEIDTREGHPDLVKDGGESLAELQCEHDTLPKTLMFVSPTGSVHRLFRHPAGGDVDIRSGPLDAAKYPGIDIRGDRNMSVVPPSVTRKGTYRWVNVRRRVAAAPPWLLAMVIKSPRELDPFVQFGNSMRRRQVNMSELTLATAMIPNTPKTDRETWVRVGLALWAATGGSEEGYQLFRAWSRRWPEYNAEKTRTFWITITKTPDEISAGTVYHLAEEAVPDYRERAIAQDPDVIALLEEFLKLRDE